MAKVQTKEAEPSTEMKPEELADKNEEPAAEKKQPEELVDKKEQKNDKKPEEIVDKKEVKPEEMVDKKEVKPEEMVDKKEEQKDDGKSKAEIEAEELTAQRKKVAAAAQCDDFSRWVKEKCPSCPPIPRMFLYSIPVFVTLPLLYRRFFCPPKCLRIGKCSKIYPGCCEPKNLCNKPPCCNRR